ncbi:MAG: ArnT family glycosyltransferase [Salinivirgaceae bacterium]
MNRINKYIPLLIAVAALALFLPFLGSVHLFDWDEINFAESAREMLLTGDFLTVQINYQPFWEKPPLFIWMQAFSMHLFGVNEFAARFPNALCGVFTLLFLYFVGKRELNRKLGLLWVLSYAGSLLPFFYFKSAIIDPWFNLFIFASLYFAYTYLVRSASVLNVFLSALALGLAVLTKGPVAILLMTLALAVFYLQKRSKLNVKWSHVALFMLVLAVVGGFWFLLQLLNGNYSLIKDFIIYQVRLLLTEDAGHGGFLFYHFVVIVVGMFPASVFALPAFTKSKSGIPSGDMLRLMEILLWVVLILFTVVNTKIVHYSSLAYFPVSFIAAWVMYYRSRNRQKFSPLVLGSYYFLAGVFIVLTALLPFGDALKNLLIEANWVNDAFALANLQAQVHWTPWILTASVALLFSVVGVYVFNRKKESLKVYVSAIAGSLVFVFIAMMLVVPRIEAYSQRAAVEFMKSIRTEDAYVFSYGYKSYVPYFYAEVQAAENSLAYDKQWLLNGKIDKPVYCILKNTKAATFFDTFKGFKKLDEKNGFVLAIRHP